MNHQLLNSYSLKYNPFSPELPIEALMSTPQIEHLAWRLEQIAREGGFVLVTGGTGVGKSSTLRLLSERLSARGEVNVGEVIRPQAKVADFYRELGDIYGVPLRPHNRWAGSKALRQCWFQHIETSHLRPLLLVDEAQFMSTEIFEELRMLLSDRFDSRHLLTVVLCGDERLQTKLHAADLDAMRSRIRARIMLPQATTEELRQRFEHALTAAGNPSLATEGLIRTLAEHAAGNWRSMMIAAGELLLQAAHLKRAQLDEKLYLEVFSAPKPQPKTSKRSTRRGQ